MRKVEFAARSMHLFLALSNKIMSPKKALRYKARNEERKKCGAI